MIASTQITNTEIFELIAILVFKLLRERERERKRERHTEGQRERKRDRETHTHREILVDLVINSFVSSSV